MSGVPIAFLIIAVGSFWLFAVTALGAAAHDRGKSPAVYTAISLFLTPVVAYVILLASSSSSDDDQLAAGKMGKCPHCRGLVHSGITFCPHCRQGVAGYAWIPAIAPNYWKRVCLSSLMVAGVSFLIFVGMMQLGM